jgi:Bacterial SH3 domain
MRIPALGSLPNLRRHFTPTARSRLGRGRLQGNVSTAIEGPAPKGLAQLKLGPANNIVSSRATPSLKAEATCYVTQGSVGTKNHFDTDEKPTEAWIPEHFADRRLLTPFLAFLSGTRTLVAGLILVALIPNLTLGAIFWLGAINAPWSPATHQPNEGFVPAVQSAVPSPVLSSPAMLEGSAGGHITFPIALDGTDGVPARSIIAIRGLPHGSKLSSGRPYDETEWNLKPDEIGDLHLVLPSNASGEANLIIQLVGTDGAIIADAATVLKMAANSAANIPASNIETEPTQAQVSEQRTPGLEERGAEGTLANLDAATTPPEAPVPLPSILKMTANSAANIPASNIKTELAEAQASGERAQAVGERAEGTLANSDPATPPPEDPVPLPSRRPAPTAKDDANWITLTSVNLRTRPTRSAPAIGVVAKDAKLRVIGRKNRWVQVTDPTTSEKGWIYARHVAAVR